MTRLILLVWALIFTYAPNTAQNSAAETLLFVWDDAVYGHTIGENQTTATGRIATPELSAALGADENVFTYSTSPLTDAPIDGYGFYQGIWSSDRRVFVFLAIQPDGAGYHVIQVENEGQRIVFSGEISPERGYLVPVGWADDGTLILLERFSLYTLTHLRLWGYSSADSALFLRTELPLPELKGNHARVKEGWVFIGFDTVGQLGYLVHPNSGQLTSFVTTFALKDPPASVFEIYPIAVVGVTSRTQFQAWLTQAAPTETVTMSDSYAPFLYWPLPDEARSITCYPDSEWTDLSFSMECPGLTTPREYQGHEGTDVGGKPDGLPLGTPVYAAARGLVIRQNRNCPREDITCGDAYGNYVLLEHSRVIHHQVETWFTGYAHLQTVLVETHDFVQEIGLPIALSGDTGFGGAHLHVEIRAPYLPSDSNWIDPWDTRWSVDGASLWLGESTHPTAAIVAAPPKTLQLCQTIDGNNIRSGPGTDFEAVGKTTAGVEYQVFQIQRVEAGSTIGDWYHIRWSEPQLSGWIWSDLMTTCTAVMQ